VPGYSQYGLSNAEIESIDINAQILTIHHFYSTVQGYILEMLPKQKQSYVMHAHVTIIELLRNTLGLKLK
jgi:hypothetical protein